MPMIKTNILLFIVLSNRLVDTKILQIKFLLLSLMKALPIILHISNEK